MAKSIIEVGDVFGNWTVIGLEENSKKYNYNYICKCTCGFTRTIRKDKLLSFKYPKCERCASYPLILKKANTIKALWDSEINGRLGSLKALNIDTVYNWKCPNGHTFKSSIRLLNGCSVCNDLLHSDKAKELIQTNYEGLVRFIDDVTHETFDKVKIAVHDDYHILWIEFENAIILAIPKYCRSFDYVLHGTKKEFLEVLNYTNSLIDSAVKSDKEHIIIDITHTETKQDKTDILKILGHIKKKNNVDKTVI